MTTVKASLGGRVPLVNLDEGTPIPRCFVFQLPDKLTPTHVGDGFRQAVVFDHVLDVQTLDADHLVFADDASRELVLRVTASITDASVDLGDLEMSLIPVLRTFFLLGKTSLGACQLLLIDVPERGITNGLTCGEDHHGLQAQIKSHLRLHHRQGLDVFLNQNGDKGASGCILRDGHGCGLTSKRNCGRHGQDA